MPKVLFTASTFSHIRRFHLPYLRQFREMGWTVHVACGGAPEPIPCADEVLSVPLEKKLCSLGNLRAARLLSKKIAREGYALICTHTSLAAFYTRLALPDSKNRPRVANMVHGYLFDDETPWLTRRALLAAEQWMAPRTDLVLTMNQYDFTLAKRYRLGTRVVRIPGVGVDFASLGPSSASVWARLRADHQIPPDAFVLIYAAEFSRRKSQRILIHAMEKLPETAVLALPGEGDLLGECKELAASLESGRRVIFPGLVQNMADWYAAADAAVSASRSEGLPFHIMEAMYAGLPVVASEVKGHTDLIRHGESGLLYRYGDADGCAARLRELISSEPLRQRLARNALENVAQYGLERVFPQVFAQYSSLGLV